MAHYAFLDDNNIVTEVIVGKDEGEDGVDWEQHYGTFRGQSCRRTSYNTQGGVHYGSDRQPFADQTKAFRKNYAGLGYTYDAERDAFIPPKPFASWVLNEDSCLWDAPVEMPADAGTGEPPKRYTWDEATTSWVEQGA
jgi:hypothetical protein